MTLTRGVQLCALWLAMLALTVQPSWAQLTTGTVAGVVTDAQGNVIPGATVVLTSEARGTVASSVTTSETGDFVFANVAPDTYTLEVTLDGFRPLRHAGVAVSGGDRVALGRLALSVGGVSESVDVTANTGFIQAQSGERSFTIPTTSVQNLPVLGRSFLTLGGLAPGVTLGEGTFGAPTRIGGGGDANVMMDGVSTMDTGNNRPLLQMNVESISEVKVLVANYQAEFGRNSGVHISAVTKGGTNQFRGSVYDVERNSNWNANSRLNILNGDPKPRMREREWGYSIGGPVGRPGGRNKVFFFYAQEFAPRTGGGDVVRYRMPTAAERGGDFSQSIDNNGTRYNLIRDASTGLPCTASNTSGCFQDGGVLGRIPANRLYDPGLRVLDLYPLPNVDRPGAAYNFELQRPQEKLLAWQPAVRLDYQPSTTLRTTFKYSGWQQKKTINIGTLPGFGDTTQTRPIVNTWAVSANYTLTSSMFLEATYGRSKNEQAGCGLAVLGSGPIFCTNGIPVNDVANRNLVGLGSLPLLFPNAGRLDPRYYATEVLSALDVVSFQNGEILKPPAFVWGNRIANPPPNVPFPAFINANFNQDFAVSLTRVMGRHTLKTGFFNTHSLKYSAVNTPFLGSLTFGNDANNPLDSTFGFANAALGIYSQYQQASGYVEGRHVFNNTEGYIQDTWRVTERLTLDYGVRLVHEQPEYDTLLQSPNFLPDRWNPAAAPLLYTAGCANNSYPCSGANRQAMHPVTGALLGPGTTAMIGAIVPNTGDTTNGLAFPGQDIVKTGFTGPALNVGPRFGMAYDVKGTQTFVLRGGGGLFFNRVRDGNRFNVNPPLSTLVSVNNGQLQSLSTGGLTTMPAPSIVGWQYESPAQTSAQWSAGIQTLLPSATALDVSYVGHHTWNLIENVPVGAIDFGTAFRPEFQDPTLAASSTPGATAVSAAQMSPMRGYNGINMTLNRGWRTYHSIQFSINRRFRNGLQFGFNDTWSLYDHASTPARFQHAADGSYAYRADQAEADELLGNQRPIAHTLKGNFVWDLPDVHGRRVLGWLLNDWQVAGVWTATTGADYIVNFAYQNGGSSINLTGSPHYNARIRVEGDPGDGCSDDPLRQFNTSAFLGPQTNSVGLESGNGYLRGCFRSTFDTSFARNIRLPRGQNIQLRVDLFNAFNSATITGRNTTMALTSPNDAATATNLPFDASGNPIPARTVPSGAGFGVANAYQLPRAVQLQIRFAF